MPLPENDIPAALRRGVSSLVTVCHDGADSLVWPRSPVGGGSRSGSQVSGPVAAWCPRDPGQAPPAPPAREQPFGSIWQNWYYRRWWHCPQNGTLWLATGNWQAQSTHTCPTEGKRLVTHSAAWLPSPQAWTLPTGLYQGDWGSVHWLH